MDLKLGKEHAIYFYSKKSHFKYYWKSIISRDQVYSGFKFLINFWNFCQKYRYTIIVSPPGGYFFSPCKKRAFQRGNVEKCWNINCIPLYGKLLLHDTCSLYNTFHFTSPPKCRYHCIEFALDKISKQILGLSDLRLTTFFAASCTVLQDKFINLPGIEILLHGYDTRELFTLFQARNQA